MHGFTYWLASYPKSGNTYVRALLNAYLYGDKFHLNNMDAVISEPKLHSYLSMWNTTEPFNMYDWACMKHAALRQWYESQRLHTRFIVKTHTANAQYYDIPMISAKYTRKAVYITRDPRDVLVSAAAYFGSSVEEQWELMRNDEHSLGFWDSKMSFQPCSSWKMNVLSWLNEEKFPVLHVKYEDLVKYPHIEFTKILKFYDITPDHKRVSKAVELTRFDRLKKAEQKYGFKDNLPTNLNEDGRDQPFFRKGVSGQWRTDLDQKLADAVYQEYRDIEHLWLTTP